MAVQLQATDVVDTPMTMQDSLNQWFRTGVGGDERPITYDIDAVCPALRRLERNYCTIRDEMMPLLAHRNDLPRYHEIDPGRIHISNETEGQSSWRVHMLYAMGAKPKENREKCPKLCRMLDETPNLFQAFFSILEPRKSVPPHQGPYAGYLRYHLPLIVPTDKPPKMRILDHWHTWKEGEGVLFCDHYEHEVVNNSDQIRVVLIVDIFRPMPFMRDIVNRFITRTRLRRRYGQRIANGQQPNL